MTEHTKSFHAQVPELDTRQSVAVGLLEAEWQIAEFVKVGNCSADVYWVSFSGVLQERLQRQRISLHSVQALRAPGVKAPEQ